MNHHDPPSGTAMVRAHYATFWLLDDDTEPESLPSPTNGLVAAGQPGVVAVATGVHSGPVVVGAQPHTSPPRAVRVDEWDEVVDLSVEAPLGHLRIAGREEGTIPGLPALTAAGPGTYRLRVHARNRDAMRDLVAVKPVEEYLLTCWPAAPAPETVHKATDTTGAGLRLSVARNAARPSTPRRTSPSPAPRPWGQGSRPSSGRGWRFVPPRGSHEEPEADD